jgi:hypothetical protein
MNARKLCARLFVVVFALSAAELVVADDPPRCPVRPACAPGGDVPPDHLQECPKCTLVPLTVSLTCVSSPGTVWCEASPQAADGRFEYFWSASGAVSAPEATDTHSPLMYADCPAGGGTVTVTITAANSQVGAAVALVRCARDNFPRDHDDPL